MAKELVCSKETLQKNLSGKVYIVTGTTSGIGLATVKQLAKQSATVICALRNVALANKISAEIIQETSNKNIHNVYLELGSLDSVKDFVTVFNKKFSRLDGLVNNAGVMNTPKQKTTDGFELQFGVNFLGHFLLTELLLPKLKKAKKSRIVNTSSYLHEMSSIDLTDLNYETRKYSGWDAYNQSKLAQVLYSRYQAGILKSSNVTSVSIHPGWVQTALIKHTLPLFFQDVLLKPFVSMAGMTNTTIGSQTTLHCLIDDSVTDKSGCFFSYKGLYKDKESRSGGWPMKSPNNLVYDDELCEELFKVASSMVGIK